MGVLYIFNLTCFARIDCLHPPVRNSPNAVEAAHERISELVYGCEDIGSKKSIVTQ